METDTLVFFGGWDAPAVYDDVFSLDLTTFEFEKVQLAGLAPAPRRCSYGDGSTYVYGS